VTSRGEGESIKDDSYCRYCLSSEDSIKGGGSLGFLISSCLESFDASGKVFAMDVVRWCVKLRLWSLECSAGDEDTMVLLKVKCFAFVCLVFCCVIFASEKEGG